jgi:N-hydroxyarylamine O-acetyltransferase
VDDPAGVFRFDASVDGRTIASRRAAEGGEFEPQYDFTMEPRRLADFGEMCRYHQTSPDSHFTRGTVCSMATPDGRITLAGDRLIETTWTAPGAARTETPVRNGGERIDILRRRFGIVL